MSSISRRDFLKLGALGAAGLTLAPRKVIKTDWLADNLARIAINSVSVYSEPSDQSRIVYQRYRDEIVNLYYEVQSDQPPLYNPRWYKVWGGYIHSAHLQKVKYQINPVTYNLPKYPVAAQVTVPYTQSYWDRKNLGWEKEYRLYYQSIHWIVGITQGPDGEPWYQVMDQLLRNVTFYAKAEHFHMLTANDFTPINPENNNKKRIEVSIDTQTLTAYEGDQIMLQTKISSGMPDYGHPNGEASTNTPLGEFNVFSKMPSKHMGDGNVTGDLEAYELPGIPWTTFFYEPTGVAFHGTYWHDNFGHPMSHGCINMRLEEAQWIFRWTTPQNLGDKIEQTGYGTRVIVY